LHLAENKKVAGGTPSEKRQFPSENGDLSAEECVAEPPREAVSTRLLARAASIS
jgi:hypothetical protein